VVGASVSYVEEALGLSLGPQIAILAHYVVYFPIRPRL